MEREQNVELRGRVSALLIGSVDGQPPVRSPRQMRSPISGSSASATRPTSMSSPRKLIRRAEMHGTVAKGDRPDHRHDRQRRPEGLGLFLPVDHVAAADEIDLAVASVVTTATHNMMPSAE